MIQNSHSGERPVPEGIGDCARPVPEGMGDGARPVLEGMGDGARPVPEGMGDGAREVSLCRIPMSYMRERCSDFLICMSDK